MYGLPQAGRNFNRHFNDKLLAAGFIQLQEDSCLYVRKNKGQVTIVAIYVDDIYIAGSTNVLVEEFLDKLRADFKVKVIGIPAQLLGVKLDWGEGFRTVKLSVPKAINKLVSDFKQEGLTKAIPMRLGLKLTKDQCPSEADQYKPKTAEMQKRYRSLVGSLL
jgi:hypothetical protein